MNILKLGLAGIVAVLALTLFASTQPAKPASADPQGVIALNEGHCIALGVAFGGLTALQAAPYCQGMQSQFNFQNYIHCLRGFDLGNDGTHDCLVPNPNIDPDSSSFPLRSPVVLQGNPADFTPLDLDKNLIHFGEDYEIIAFVKDDFPVLFKTDKGAWITNGLQEFNCETLPDDPDCDGVPPVAGDDNTTNDGVVVQRLRLRPQDGVTGTVNINVIQENISYPIQLTIVGPAETITLTPLFGKNTIQTGATQATNSDCGGGPCQSPDPTDCNFAATVDGVLGANNQAEKAIVVAKALDNAGNEVSGALINWNHSFKKFNPNIADDLPNPPDLGPLPQGGVALPQTPTLDAGALGVGFPQFVCGGDTPGDLTLTATFNNGPPDEPSPTGKNEQTSVTIHVVGPGTNMTLAADPPEIDCNGTNTTKITAKVVQATGDPVADGLDVNFSVQALGTVNPLIVNTGKGEASTVLTPLSGAANLTADGGPAGVIVTASANGQIRPLYGAPANGPHQEWDQITRSILVRCSGGPPPPGTGILPAGSGAPAGGSAGAGAAPGRITGPDTGSGGAAGGAAAAPWTLLALVAAAMTLGGAAVALRRNG